MREVKDQFDVADKSISPYISVENDVKKVFLIESASSTEQSRNLSFKTDKFVVDIAYASPPLTFRGTSSTQIMPDPTGLSSRLELLFKYAREEYFEDGMESNFSKSLIKLMSRYEEQAIKVLAGLVHQKETSAEVSSEALRWIGHIYHPKTFQYRFWLLTEALTSTSARVRDGALLGLSFMDTTRSIPALHKAIDSEKIESLKNDMKALLLDLESRASAKAS